MFNNLFITSLFHILTCITILFKLPLFNSSKTMSEFAPTNSLVNPLLTDMYQISMAYAYWKNGKSEDPAVFDLFFRKNPFEGEFCIFAGIDEVVKFLASFK